MAAWNIYHVFPWSAKIFSMSKIFSSFVISNLYASEGTKVAKVSKTEG